MKDRKILAWRAPNNALAWSTQETGSEWASYQYSGIQTSHGPALVTLEDTVYAAWKALDSEQIWWARFTGAGWSDVGPLSVVAGEALTSDTPALITTGIGLVMAWKGVQPDSRIWLSEYQLGSWSAPHQAAVPPEAGSILTSHGPALATPQGVSFLAWKGAGNDQQVWSSKNSNGQWTTPTPINAGINSYASPTAASYAVNLL